MATIGCLHRVAEHIQFHNNEEIWFVMHNAANEGENKRQNIHVWTLRPIIFNGVEASAFSISVEHVRVIAFFCRPIPYGNMDERRGYVQIFILDKQFNETQHLTSHNINAINGRNTLFATNLYNVQNCVHRSPHERKFIMQKR